MHDDELPLFEQPEIQHRRWFLLAIMCLSVTMVVMAVSGLNVAIPSLQRDLEATATDLQWIVDSYAIVFAGLLLSAGAIGDRFGRKRALQGGLFVFGLGAAFGTFADDVPMVIVARVVMGIGAAFAMPATLSIVSAVFPPHERAKAIAVWAGFAGAGGALGPLVVGFLLTEWWIFPSYWWGSAFLINVATVAVVLPAVTIWSPRSKDPDSTPLDPLGAGLSIVGLTALVYGIIEGPVKGWSSTEVVVAFVVAAVTLVGFVLWELRATHPMLPMDYFANRGFSLGSGVITFTFFVMFGFFFLMTQYLQFVRDYSPLDAGVATLPLAVTLVATSPRSAALAARYGETNVISVGFTFVVIGFGLLSRIDAATPYVLLAVAFVFLGAGMGVTVAPATGSIMAAVPMGKAGVGSAVNDTTREVGGALGIAVLGSVANSVYRDEIDPGLLAQLPSETADVVGESIGGALVVAAQAPPEAADAAAVLADEAKDAFVSAFTTTMGMSSLVALALGLTVFAIGRRGGSSTTPDHSAPAPAEAE